MPRFHSHATRAFTLLELSVVMALVGFIAAGALVTLTASVQSTQYNASVARMQAIDTALLNYRTAFNRIPCPSELDLSNTSANYGLEANAGSGSSVAVGSGACTGGTPYANFSSGLVAEGGVPVRALNLPDSFMYDGWGNTIKYAVDVNMTATNAFTTYGLYPQSCQEGNISIYDAAGLSGSTNTNIANRSSQAIYALISAGQNGHGAYSQNGTPVDSQSTNYGEQVNCHCNNTGTSQGYPYTPSGVSPAITTPTYIQMAPTGDSTTLTDTFDDIVTFKERWQMQTPMGDTLQGTTCPYMVVSTNTSPYLYLYKFIAGNLTPLANNTSSTGLSSMASNLPLSYLYFTANNANLLAPISNASSNTNMVYSLSVSGSGLNYISGTTENGQGGYLSKDGTLLAEYIYNYSGPTVYLYHQSSGVLTSYGSFTNPAGHYPVSLAISPTNSTIYTLGGAGSGDQHGPSELVVFTVSGSSITQAYDYSESSGTFTNYGYNYALSLDPTGQYLAVGTQGDVYVVNNPASGSPTFISLPITIAANSLKWSPDGTMLATYSECSSGTNALRVFSFNSSTQTFTQATFTSNTCTPSGSCGGTLGNILAWTNDSKYLAEVDAVNSGSVCLFQRSGTNFTNIPIPSGNLPAGIPQAVSFSN